MLKKHGFHLRKIIPHSDSILKPRYLPLKNFKPKVKLLIERDRFVIKTAENHDELAKVLRLRYEVFYRELLEKRQILGMDIDKFDFSCDHLIIIDKKTDTFIGTYRLISSLFTNKFYSETEFNLQNIVALSGTKLELGRACVHRDYRNGSSIALLWRGITEYMKETGTKYMFGCSSVKTTDKQNIAAIYKNLSNNYLASQVCLVTPKRKFKIKDFDVLTNSVSKEAEDGAVEKIPPLIKSYLNMGGLICGEPAYDKKFKCADLFTLFNIDSLSDKVHKKYNI
jgi:putative hemolysin